MSFNGDLYPTAGADVVMTTKGDVVRYDSQRERYGIGSTGQVLSVTAGLPAWATLTTADSVLTTQGDVLYESASGLARLGFGTSGDVLTTKGTGANPVWETPSASGANTALSNLASVSVNDTIDMNTQNLTNTKFLGLKTYESLTISSGNVTFGQSLCTVDTEASASTDQLDGFLGMTTGYFLVLKSTDSARDVELRSGISGENKMSGAGNFTLSNTDYKWTGIGDTATTGYFTTYELSRSANTG